MSGRVMGELYKVKLPRHLRIVAQAYADHANDDGSGVWPSVGLIAWKTDLDRRTVQRHTRTLERLGVLPIVSTEDGKSTRRQVCLDHLEPKPPYRGGGTRAAPTSGTDAAPR